MKLLTSRVRWELITVGLCLALLGRATAQGDGSLKNLDLETTPLAKSAKALTAENAELRRKLAESEKSLQSLQQNFGSLSNEVEVFRRKSFELNARLESLGPGSTDERVIKLLSELKIAATEQKRLREILVTIVDLLARCRKQLGEVDLPIVHELEAGIQEIEKALGLSHGSEKKAAPMPAMLADSLIVSIKDDLGLLVINVGAQHGVRLGMPFEILRNNVVIGTIRVVDVRNKVSGALIQNLSKNETVKVGDRLRVIGH